MQDYLRTNFIRSILFVVISAPAMIAAMKIDDSMPTWHPQKSPINTSNQIPYWKPTETIHVESRQINLACAAAKYFDPKYPTMAQLGIAFFELQSLNEGMHIKHPTYIKIRNLFCHPNKKYALDESMHSPYFFAAALGDFHLMHFLRTCLISQKNTINPSNGLSVAHYAAYYGQESIFQYIAIDHCFPIDIMDGDSNTPLHLAAAQGHVTCVKELLKLGASPSTRNGEGKTPLSLATNEDVIHIMLEYIIQLPKSDPEKDTAFIASETANDTALMAAVKLNDTTRTRRLLTESTVNVNTQDLNGNTPLHEAIKNGNVPMVRELLAKTKINVNARTKRGFTALHYAIQYGYTRLADMLIAAHIEINAQNNDGNTAEQLAE